MSEGDAAAIQEGQHGKLDLNRAVEAIGFGYFQKKLMLICAVGLFIDAMEGALLKVLFPILEFYWHLNHFHLAALSSLCATGMAIGAFVGGRLSDHFGRTIIFQFSLIISACFGLISAFAPDFWWFAIFRLILGIGYGANVVIDLTMVAEFVPAKNRGSNLMLTGLGWGLGAILTSGLAWLITPRLGWRWLIGIAASPGLLIFFFRRGIPESPRYLMEHGREEEAREVLLHIARQNGVAGDPHVNSVLGTSTSHTQDSEDPTHYQESDSLLQGSEEQRRRQAHPPSSSDDYEESPVIVLDESPRVCGCRRERDNKALAELSKPQLDLRRLCCEKEQSKSFFPLLLVWFFFAIGNQITMWLPLHIHDFELSQPSISTKTEVERATYLSVLLLHLGDIPAGIFVFLYVDKIPRLTFIPISFMLLGLGTAALGFVTDLNVLLGILPIEACLITAAHTVIYLYTPEVFPTALRATGFGMCSCIYRLAPVFAPYIVASLYDLNFWYVSLTLGICYFISAGLALFLTKETLNVQLK